MPRLFHVRAEKARDKLHKKNMQNLCIPTKFMPGFVETIGIQKEKTCEKNIEKPKNERF
jgi:hypothetical protein